ncbi:MAG: ATP synthase F0 subunit B [Thermoleophilaceae bacterium]
MLNNVVSSAGSLLSGFVGAELEPPSSDLNPIAPELKEIIWGFGSFAVLAIVLRYLLWPKLRGSIDARNQRIADDLAQAEQLTESAKADVADYEAQRAALRVEAQQKVEEARATLEAQRAERLAEVNARIAERRSAALAEVEAARAEAAGDVETAVAAVVGRVVELATGRAPDPETVRRAVEATVREGVAR